MRVLVTFTFYLLLFIVQTFGMHQYEEKINSLEFGPVEMAVRTDLIVLHMQMDKMYPGNVLFSSGEHIYSMDMENGESTKIIGSNFHAEGGLRFGVGDPSETFFGRITSFIQLLNNDILMLDEGNSVIVLVKRGIRGITSEIFSGAPGTSMDEVRGGSYRDARFYEPRDIARFGTNDAVFFVSEPKLRAICKLRNIGDGDVERHVLEESQLIIGLTYSLFSNTLFASSDSQLFKVNPRDVSLTPITESDIRNGAEPYYKDGPLNRATFGFASGLTALDDDTLLVLDSTNHRLRVVNLNGGVTSICGGDPSDDEANGQIDQCVMHDPLSSTWFNSSIVLIGTFNGVWRMSVKTVKPENVGTTQAIRLTDKGRNLPPPEPPEKLNGEWTGGKTGTRSLTKDHTSFKGGVKDKSSYPVAMKQRSVLEQAEYNRKLAVAQKSARAAIFVTMGMLCVLMIIVVAVAIRVYNRMNKKDQLIEYLESQNHKRLTTTGSLAWELNRLEMLRQAEDAAITEAEEKIYHTNRKLSHLETKIRIRSHVGEVSPHPSTCRRSQAMTDMVVENV